MCYNNAKTEVIHMPRGKKKSALQTTEEQIQKIDASIEKYQDKVKELETKRKILLDSRKRQEIESLYEKIQASGKSIEDILKVLDNQ